MALRLICKLEDLAMQVNKSVNGLVRCCPLRVMKSCCTQKLSLVLWEWDTVCVGHIRPFAAAQQSILYCPILTLCLCLKSKTKQKQNEQPTESALYTYSWVCRHPLSIVVVTVPTLKGNWHIQQLLSANSSLARGWTSCQSPFPNNDRKAHEKVT